MAGNQELMQAFQIWQDAIGQKNAQDALFQSTKLAEQIQSSNMEQYEKEQQLKGLGNNLAAFLSQQGQAGQAAALAANAISGGGPDKPKSIDDALLNEKAYAPEIGQRARQLRDEENDLIKELTRIKSENSNKGVPGREDRLTDQFATEIKNKFEKNISKVKEMYLSTDGLLQRLLPDSASKNDVDIATVKEAQAQTAKFFNGGGRLTDQDIEFADINPELKIQLKRYISQKLWGKPIKEDVESYRIYLAARKVILAKQMRAEADAYVKLHGREAPGGSAQLKSDLYSSIDAFSPANVEAANTASGAPPALDLRSILVPPKGK